MQKKIQTAVHQAPWKKVLHRVLTPIEEFIRKQSTSSMLLMICAVVALVLANSPYGDVYQTLLHKNLSLTIANKVFGMSVLHWINDGLMAIFFLIMGLELKRELVVGELADIRRALLPIIAAVGGMVVPALFYFFMNPAGVASAGWGIPMATDIAFAIGALSLLGNRVPRTLVVFLIALAIVDDLGAVLVIAVFYTSALHNELLLGSALLVFVLVIFNLGGVRRLLPYLLVGVALWCTMLGSGVHATVAGVILAFCIPVKPKHDSLQAPATRLEHALHVYVAYLVIPIFALANAAIPVDIKNITAQVGNPVALGVISGLLLGKFLGITGMSWLAVKSGWVKLPDELNMQHMIGVGLLGGIGFTMSIFIADLGFANYPQELLMAKTGVLFASLLAGSTGIAWLWFTGSESGHKK